MIREDFKEYAIEIVLSVLRVTSNQIDKFNEIGDLSGKEILEEKVIKPYEKIYGALLEMDLNKLGDEEKENLVKSLEDIREKNNLSVEQIEKNLEAKEKYKKESGAEVVKKFYKYNLNRLLEKKDILVEKYNNLAKEEEKLENLLKDTIQEAEQFDIIYQLQPVREKLREVEKKYLELEKEIETIKNKLESKWTYEIYSIISEGELLETYKEIFKMEE